MASVPQQPLSPEQRRHSLDEESGHHQPDTHTHPKTVTPSYRQNTVSNVILHGIPIVALLLDNKERLCLAQISNTLLKRYSYNEIHNRRVALGITCVQCTPVQLEILRRAGAMPVSSRRCGMISKREAERLVKSFLEETLPPKLPDDFAFEVEHCCGWGCKGCFIPSRYNSSRAKCIKCSFCNAFFSPNKFIFHYHRTSESTYTHPDAANFNSWRRHIKLSPAGMQNDSILYAWEDVKAMFNGGSRKRMMSSARASLSGGNDDFERQKLKKPKTPENSNDGSMTFPQFAKSYVNMALSQAPPRAHPYIPGMFQQGNNPMLSPPQYHDRPTGLHGNSQAMMMGFNPAMAKAQEQLMYSPYEKLWPKYPHFFHFLSKIPEQNIGFVEHAKRALMRTVDDSIISADMRRTGDSPVEEMDRPRNLTKDEQIDNPRHINGSPDPKESGSPSDHCDSPDRLGSQTDQVNRWCSAFRPVGSATKEQQPSTQSQNDSRLINSSSKPNIRRDTDFSVESLIKTDYRINNRCCQGMEKENVCSTQQQSDAKQNNNNDTRSDSRMCQQRYQEHSEHRESEAEESLQKKSVQVKSKLEHEMETNRRIHWESDSIKESQDIMTSYPYTATMPTQGRQEFVSKPVVST